MRSRSEVRDGGDRASRLWRRVAGLVFWAIPVTAASACASPSYLPPSATPALGSHDQILAWHLVRTLGHSAGSYTEGLVFAGERLFESVGWVGQSRLLELQPETGAVLHEVRWPSTIGSVPTPPYAEGLADEDGRLVELSWKNQVALTWNEQSFARGPDLGYAGEGWGLCFDGKGFWRSDGSANLRRHARGSFAERDGIPVSLGGESLGGLNELECVGDWVFANVWRTPFAVRIEASTGQVTGVLDFSRLIEAANATGRESVLNGIAYRSSTKEFYITGKRWPHIYVVKLDG